MYNHNQEIANMSKFRLKRCIEYSKNPPKRCVECCFCIVGHNERGNWCTFNHQTVFRKDCKKEDFMREVLKEV